MTANDTSPVLDILNNTDIDGFNIADALARLNNNTDIFMRIIRSFVKNMPSLLTQIALPSKENLADYAIKVHGAKGSLYGIGAQAAGDAAKELEMAAKADDLTMVLAKNEDFIASVNRLLDQILALIAQIEATIAHDFPTKLDASAPSKEQLHLLLVATKNYDLDAMQEIITELVSKRYKYHAEDISFIKEQFEAFDYEQVLVRVEQILNEGVTT
ncbi:MAG: hypothetical protein LBG97_00015 [Coriobacteriales bacterium]|jgi:HPt (histidine-containing phosphotransfer) domain-containing protein|nr:hypothetical protein [Coriobacteriales bacterium]